LNYKDRGLTVTRTFDTGSDLTRTREFFKDYQNCTSACFFKLHEKPYYYLLIIKAFLIPWTGGVFARLGPFQAFSQKGVQASWDAPRTKSGRLWTPKFWAKREIIFNDSLNVLIYPKRNSFNSHYFFFI
jgi:hypothetical protein